MLGKSPNKMHISISKSLCNHTIHFIKTITEHLVEVINRPFNPNILNIHSYDMWHTEANLTTKYVHAN